MKTLNSTHAKDQHIEKVYDLFARHVSSGKAAFFKSTGIDFTLGRREGAYIHDIEGGKRLIDCHCNGGVFNLGHRNPEIIQALMNSLEELDIGNHHLVSEPRAVLANALAAHAPGDLHPRQVLCRSRSMILTHYTRPPMTRQPPSSSRRSPPRLAWRLPHRIFIRRCATYAITLEF